MAVQVCRPYIVFAALSFFGAGTVLVSRISVAGAAVGFRLTTGFYELLALV